MDSVVVDTNVLVSALIGKGNPRKVLEIILSGRVSFCLSTPVFSEYVAVLRRPKFAQYSEFAANASLTLKSLQGIVLFSEPKILIRACPDPDDDKFLTLAVSAGARYLVTGNNVISHFEVSEVHGSCHQRSSSSCSYSLRIFSSASTQVSSFLKIRPQRVDRNTRRSKIHSHPTFYLLRLTGRGNKIQFIFISFLPHK